MSFYVPLHVHSEYSLLDGLSQTKHIARRLEEIDSSKYSSLESLGICTIDAGTESQIKDLDRQHTIFQSREETLSAV